MKLSRDSSQRAVQLLIATNNEGKIREVREALASLPLTIFTLEDFSNITAIDETGETYEANAILKAIGYAEQTGLLALADDSGLEVDALGGKPGVFSARFGGVGATDSDRVQKLLTLLSGKATEVRNARFVCCMALAGAQSAVANEPRRAQLLTVIEERCEGSIATAPRGVNGFGYDPIFVPAGYSATFGELPSDIKRRISHRGKALNAVCTFLRDRLSQT